MIFAVILIVTNGAKDCAKWKSNNKDYRILFIFATFVLIVVAAAE